IALSGFLRSMPTCLASGSHHAPRPQMMRLGARSSSVKKVAASKPILRVQLLITPLPTFMREVTAAKAAIGTIASRTRRDSACHTASKPRCSAYCAYAMPSRMVCLSCRYIATRAIEFSFQRTMLPQFDDLNVVFATEYILLLLDFAETDRPIFNMGLLRRQ